MLKHVILIIIGTVRRPVFEKYENKSTYYYVVRPGGPWTQRLVIPALNGLTYFGETRAEYPQADDEGGLHAVEVNAGHAVPLHFLLVVRVQVSVVPRIHTAPAGSSTGDSSAL